MKLFLNLYKMLKNEGLFPKTECKKISKKGVDIPLRGKDYTKCTEKHEQENFSCACCAHCKQDELREKKKTVKVPNPEQEKAKQKRNV